MYRHESLAAFHLFVKAGDFPQAHRIAVEDLGPEIVIRGDLELLDEMFTLLDPHQIAGWTEQGYVSQLLMPLNILSSSSCRYILNTRA